MLNRSLYLFTARMAGYAVRLVLSYFLVRLMTVADFGAYLLDRTRLNTPVLSAAGLHTRVRLPDLVSTVSGLPVAAFAIDGLEKVYRS
jgi:hypothetical protein